jgi:hypothetical protein
VLFGPVPAGFLPGRDFQVFWHASHLFWRGQYAILFDQPRFADSLAAATGGGDRYRPFPYPPLAFWFILPLAALPYFASLLAWLTTTFAGYAWIMRRFFSSTPQCVAVLLGSPASFMNLSSGQNGFLSAALLCGGLLLLETRPVLAGVLIGALSFKPQLGLLIPFVLIAGGYYRSFAAAAATVALLILVSLLITGPGPWQTFLSTGLAGQHLVLDRYVGVFQTMIPSFVMAARLLQLPPWLGYAAQAVAALAALLGCCWAIRRPAPHEYKVAVVLVGVLIAAPYSFNYDMTLLVAAQVMAWRGHRRSDAVAHGIAWLLPILMIVTGLANVPIGPLALVALFYLLMRQTGASSSAFAR